MKKLIARIFIVVVACLGGTLSAQNMQDVFMPTVFWSESMDRGVILTKPTEMVVIDAKGNKHEKVTAAEDVSGVYMAPDGKKIVYTTPTSVWLVIVETGQAQLVVTGDCYYLRWNADGLSFIFAVRERKKEAVPIASSCKLFWADGEGKNLKQVYP